VLDEIDVLEQMPGQLAVWDRVLKRLVTERSSTVAKPVQITGTFVEDGRPAAAHWGACYDIVIEVDSVSNLRLCGVVSLNINRGEPPLISCALLPFVGRERLRSPSGQADILCFTYDLKRGWRPGDWQGDDNYEWLGHEDDRRWRVTP